MLHGWKGLAKNHVICVSNESLRFVGFFDTIFYFFSVLKGHKIYFFQNYKKPVINFTCDSFNF